MFHFAVPFSAGIGALFQFSFDFSIYRQVFLVADGMLKAWCISIIPIKFRYDWRMTKELIPRQFYDLINQMIAAIILNRVRF